MGVEEDCALRRQGVDVRRFDLWVAAQAADPIVLVVDRNEQNVRLVSGDDVPWQESGGEKQGGNGRCKDSHGLAHTILEWVVCCGVL